jgi:hypothetical protein
MYAAVIIVPQPELKRRSFREAKIPLEEARSAGGALDLSNGAALFLTGQPCASRKLESFKISKNSVDNVAF